MTLTCSIRPTKCLGDRGWGCSSKVGATFKAWIHASPLTSGGGPHTELFPCSSSETAQGKHCCKAGLLPRPAAFTSSQAQSLTVLSWRNAKETRSKNFVRNAESSEFCYNLLNAYIALTFEDL
uniref:Uncharacterized protein n=1 Tax=Rousettus aegyptiacus TaxID=9407 RepID=A0A7J8DXH4_ROUAE|nr:hypothetical protein HJG63_008358 [Rousettus aegyptiacus]